MILRYRSPEIPRTFRTPLMPITPIVGIIFCVALIASLPPSTWVRFAIWLAIGLVIYFLYGIRKSRLATERDVGL